MTTIVHLLRHASHGELGRVLTGRRPDIPLSAIGRQEANALGRCIATMRIDDLYTSPQLRALQTAEIIAGEVGLNCRVAEELDEIDFGCWSGMAFDVLSLDLAWRRWNMERNFAATPAGDTMTAVALRLADLIGRLRREYAGGAVGLVSHADVIKAGLCHFLGWSFSSVHDFEIGPASLTTLAFEGEDCSLRALDVRAILNAAESAA